MRILVSAKRVIDPYVKIRINPEHTAVETQLTKMVMNPFDEIALEAALRLKETGFANDILLVAIGQENSQEILRHGLALGADRAILIQSQENHCSLHIAKILKALVLKEDIQLVLMGKQSIDGDNNQTPQMLASLLDWPMATYASQIMIDNHLLRVTREMDHGLETLEMSFPAVISADLRLNEPRYASLQNIMKAQKKPLEKMDIASLSLTPNLRKHTESISINEPPKRASGIRLQSAQELVEKLSYDAHLL